MNERNGRRGNAWFRVHRVLGLVSALFVLLLAVTGLALNHTERLDLDSRYVSDGRLLDWYGIEAPPEPVSFQAGGSHLTLMGDRLWLGAEPVLDDVPGLEGVVASGRFLVAALGDEMALFTRDGRLVERLGTAAGVPEGIRRVGSLPGGDIAVSADAGSFRAGPALGDWRRGEVDDADWSRPSVLPANTRTALDAAWRGRGLSLERVLLDLHSGRLLGTFGVWLMDAMAILFVVLAATGLWIWTKRRNSRRNGRGRHPGKPN